VSGSPSSAWKFPHVHLVPIDGIYDIDFRRAAPAEDEELARTAERIRAALATE
jgi:hypothetical protein